jgi:hypothetical protein
MTFAMRKQLAKGSGYDPVVESARFLFDFLMEK